MSFLLVISSLYMNFYFALVTIKENILFYISFSKTKKLIKGCDQSGWSFLQRQIWWHSIDRQYIWPKCWHLCFDRHWFWTYLHLIRFIYNTNNESPISTFGSSNIFHILFSNNFTWLPSFQLQLPHQLHCCAVLLEQNTALGKHVSLAL